MTAPRALYALLAVVALAAAVLSFDALRGLALVCGFAPWLAWLLPITVDAGAGAGAVAWLGRHAGSGRVFGRALALALLVTSVAGNALGHALAAYSARPHWGVVVGVSAVAPAVLGATVHLAVLVGRGGEVHQSDTSTAPAEPVDPLTRARRLGLGDAGRPRLIKELGVTDHQAKELQRQLRQDGASTNGSAR